MLPILSNLMSSINFFKDLNSGQTRFMVSHTEKNFKTSLYEAELGIFIKDNFNKGYQHQGCERGTQKVRHPKCGYGLPNRESWISHIYNLGASQVTS